MHKSGLELFTLEKRNLIGAMITMQKCALGDYSICNKLTSLRSLKQRCCNNLKLEERRSGIHPTQAICILLYLYDLEIRVLTMQSQTIQDYAFKWKKNIIMYMNVKSIFVLSKFLRLRETLIGTGPAIQNTGA